MSKGGDKKRMGSMNRIASLMPGLGEQLRLEDKVHEMAFMSLWPEAVGKQYAPHTRAVSLQQRGNERVLLVKVGNAALASDLSFNLPVILKAMNAFEPQTGVRVDRIQLVVGTV